MPGLPMRIHTLVLLLACTASFAPAAPRLKLSTTTSTQAAGILDVLLPPFEKKCSCQVDVIAVGTGKALKLGESGDVDVVLVHARALEDRFVAAGFGINRRDVMYNDFVIIGPANDPAHISGAKTAVEAFKRIAAAQAPFISRGDESGTHEKEMELWREAGLNPQGRWYRSVGQGMGETIIMATEVRGYALTDRATYAAFKQGKTDLKILFQGEAQLFNPYSVIAVNPKKFPWVQFDLTMMFIDFITGPEGQRMIADYRIGNEPVFFVYGRK
ncbi:substrate-binding domain-containing protein [Edaphobacter aggregans]|uniref:substrate-binding domain-containing protein n=1 Tax=Edaphobacter aggregans TaxID=570835 RepID=UPI0005584424|nr:substrate-binding domain-containing protein [Edaphobacter aggregans]